MSQGTIMSLERKSAVVLTPDGRFVRLQRQPEYELGAEITYTIQRSAIEMRRWAQVGASVAALLLVLVSLWLFKPPEVVAYVTMDVNPSVEIGLDADMKVRKLRAVNPDAEAIISGVKYKGRQLEQVMEALAGNLIRTKLLVPTESEIVIASVPLKLMDSDWEARVAETMKHILSEAAKTDEAGAELDVTTISIPQELRSAAIEQGISAGKLAFWLAAASQGHEVPIDTLKQHSLKTIASEWEGDVKDVLGEKAVVKQTKEDREAAKTQWKALLNEAKENKKLPTPAATPKPSQKPKPTPKPAVKPSPSPSSGAKTPGKDVKSDDKRDNVKEQGKDDKRGNGNKRGNDDERDNDDKRGSKSDNNSKWNNDNKSDSDDRKNEDNKRGNDDRREVDDKRGQDGKRGDIDSRKDEYKRDNMDRSGSSRQGGRRND